jgi:hypothetical protein
MPPLYLCINMDILVLLDFFFIFLLFGLCVCDGLIYMYMYFIMLCSSFTLGSGTAYNILYI